MQLEVGGIYERKVTGITKFGAFVSFEGGQTGMVHISEVAPTFVTEIRDFVSEGQTVKVKVLSINEEGKISLSMKKALPEDQQRRPARRTDGPRREGGRKEGVRREGTRPPRQPRPAPQQGPARPGDFEWQSRRNDSGTFEEMMSRFKQTSDEKMSDLKRGNESRRGYSRRGQQK